MPSPDQIIATLITKADKIRALAGTGMSRADIARLLGVRYQHVRNTLLHNPATRDKTVRAQGMPIAAVEPWPIEKLITAGFVLIGDCLLSDETSFSYSVRAPNEAGVYAFAVDGVIRYVGLTRGALRTRLGHYVYGHVGQKTSARVKALILDALRGGHHVQVLTACPPAMEWNGLPVDGAAGLETGLIGLIRPDWNQQGNKG